ncbi:PepSY domain-containing protein [Alysiella filiformis]|uniref:Uncharacterized membrane protein YkoI n=1 Tax=Alysiella filiformis DSM 16848 TaxID=1120981 RepID=A0A286E7B1_9NEIS|nr:PepSY domain-containing protein [Alysiella filiformis]QMT31598.1 PepSY domain-containing protein [Alysiella filiformis]UBQ55391.1 PepSY domain-containing protein [Alysiella filiformis DSM 16848]SOD66808.1 Uncharacterized membrane protein YkoI [Alysiella filiformis DSM 16848]
MLNKKTFAILFAAASMSIAAPTFADDWHDDDEIHFSQNQHNYISHEQAAQAARAKIGAGAHVTDVEFEKKYHGAFFDVEVIDAKGREFDVRVDAKTGKVIYAKRDY